MAATTNDAGKRRTQIWFPLRWLRDREGFHVPLQKIVVITLAVAQPVHLVIERNCGSNYQIEACICAGIYLALCETPGTKAVPSGVDGVLVQRWYAPFIGCQGLIVFHAVQSQHIHYGSWQVTVGLCALVDVWDIDLFACLECMSHDHICLNLGGRHGHENTYAATILVLRCLQECITGITCFII